MTLATDAFLLEDITLPEFYSIQFEISMIWRQDNNLNNKMILGFTNDNEGNREPAFSLEKKNGNFLFVTKISSGEKIKHETNVRSDWWKKWLSFKMIHSYFVIKMQSY